MSQDVILQDVPDEVVDELTHRARKRGRSMQDYVKTHLIEFTGQPELEDWLNQLQVHRREFVGHGLTAEQILAARDADRR